MKDNMLAAWCHGVLAGDPSFRLATGQDADIRMARIAAARLLELLPRDDDGTPLTLEWINSVSGEGPVVNRGYTVSVGPLDYEPRAESVGGPVSLWPTRDGDKVLLTRGDVRRVASATGEPVKEPE